MKATAWSKWKLSTNHDTEALPHSQDEDIQDVENQHQPRQGTQKKCLLLMKAVKQVLPNLKKKHNQNRIIYTPLNLPYIHKMCNNNEAPLHISKLNVV